MSELCGVSGMSGYRPHWEIKMKNNTDKQITLMGNRWQQKKTQNILYPVSSYCTILFANLEEVSSWWICDWNLILLIY